MFVWNSTKESERRFTRLHGGRWKSYLPLVFCFWCFVLFLFLLCQITQLCLTFRNSAVCWETSSFLQAFLEWLCRFAMSWSQMTKLGNAERWKHPWSALCSLVIKWNLPYRFFFFFPGKKKERRKWNRTCSFLLMHIPRWICCYFRHSIVSDSWWVYRQGLSVLPCWAQLLSIVGCLCQIGCYQAGVFFACPFFSFH